MHTLKPSSQFSDISKFYILIKFAGHYVSQNLKISKFKATQIKKKAYLLWNLCPAKNNEFTLW